MPEVSFDELAAPMMERVRTMVWCNMATVDARSRPRSRVIHPVWDGPACWIGTRPGSFKARHLASNPYVSLAYVADAVNPVYVDARAEWVDDMDVRQQVWDLFLRIEPPLGYDPAPIFRDLAGFGLLKIIPWRIELASALPPFEKIVWRAA